MPKYFIVLLILGYTNPLLPIASMTLPQPEDLAAAQSARRKAYLHVLPPLFITSVIAYLDRVNLAYAKLTMNQDLQFSDEVFGLGAGIFFLGYVLFEIPGALIAERTSPRKWLARIMFSWGLVSGLMAFMTQVWEFYLLRFALGLAEASLYPVLYASCIPRWFGAGDRPRAIALLLASLQVSNIIGAPLAGWVLGFQLPGLEGWQTLFLLEALPALIFAVILLRWFCDDPAQATFLNADEKKWLLDQYKRECHAKLETRHYTVMQALCDPKVLKLCLIYFLWITGFWGFGYWMPSVLKALSGWSDLALGWMVVPPMCLSLGFMLWIGHRSSVTGEKRFHGAIGLFIGAVGLLLGTSFDNPWLSYLMLCMAAVGVYAPFGVWWSYPTTFLTGSAAAGAIGMINSFGNIGGFVGPYCIGWLKETSGGYTLGWVYLGLSLALAGCLMLTLRHTPRDL